MDHFPTNRGENKTYLSCHHLEEIYLMRMNPLKSTCRSCGLQPEKTDHTNYNWLQLLYNCCKVVTFTLLFLESLWKPNNWVIGCVCWIIFVSSCWTKRLKWRHLPTRRPWLRCCFEQLKPIQGPRSHVDHPASKNPGHTIGTTYGSIFLTHERKVVRFLHYKKEASNLIAMEVHMENIEETCSRR